MRKNKVMCCHTDTHKVPGMARDRSQEACLFCGFVRADQYILANDYAFVIEDKYPVSNGHSLIIPKRHVADYFDITKAEQEAIHDLLRIRRQQLLGADHTIQGFNIGVNLGEVAGQTIFHCHVHLIPRRQGDVADPRGGVRGVIPGQQFYPSHNL